MHTFTKDPSKKDNYIVGHYAAANDGKGVIFIPQFRGLALVTALTVVSALNGGGSLSVEMCKVIERCQ